MSKLRVLPGEHEELRLRPHPLSFLPRYLVAALPALWGLALWAVFGSEWWAGAQSGKWYQFWTFLYGNAPSGYVLAIVGLAALGAVVAVVGIRWRVFFTYLGTGLIAVGLTVGFSQVYGWDYAVGLPALLWLSAAPALWWVEMDRRSHRYILTNLRIVFRGGVLVTHERQLRYESITDLDGQQSLVGQMLGYGTLIPVTQSGFGLGADTSQALIGMGLGGKMGGKAPGGEAGAGAGIGVAAGGGKEVQIGRARSFHQLTGVRPYKDVKYLLETLIQNATATPYLRQQVALQEKMVEALSRLEGTRPPPATGPPQSPLFEGEQLE